MTITAPAPFTIAPGSTEEGFRAAVLASSPLAYWVLDEPTGSLTAHDQIAGVTATIGPAVVLQAPNPWGRLAAAMGNVGAGADSSIVEDVRRHLGPGAFTVECWVYAINASGVVIEFNADKVAGASRSPAISLSALGQLAGMSYPGNTQTITDGYAIVGTAAWHHIALTNSGGTGQFSALTLYRNGAVVASTNTSAPPLELDGYWHLMQGGVLVPLGGYLCHVAVYNRALAQAELLSHFTATSPPEPEPPVGGGCVRKAWLTLDDGRTVGLEGPGWFCQKLDLGSPTVREQVNNRPDLDGTTDQTKLLGNRAVEADITTLVGAGARVDEVASQFGPFVNPAARPTLHYVLDRGDNPERTLVLRGTTYSWPIIGDNQRDIQLQWVAPDPRARGAVLNSATAWAASGTAGRVYNRTYPWTYPSGSSGAVSARLVSDGDMRFRPHLRLFGPISGAGIIFVPDLTPGTISTWAQILFRSSFTISAGHFVSIDVENHTAYLDDDPTQSVLNQIDWNNLRWPDLAPLPNGWTMSLAGSQPITGATQVQATWQDVYYT